MQIDVTIIFTLFNKALEITSSVDKVIQVLRKASYSFEIILCDDGSTDNTFAVCQEIQEIYPNINVIRNNKNRGRGYSVKKAIEKSNGEKIIYMDSDISYTTDVKIVLEAIHNLDASEVIVANRFHKSVISKRKIFRKLIGYIYRLLINVFFPKICINDCEAGFKGFKKDIIKKYATQCMENRWSFDLELIWLFSINGVEIKELPMSWNEKYDNYHSSVNIFADSFSQFLGFFRIRKRHRK